MKMITLTSDQYLVAECSAELARSLFTDERAQEFGERFPNGDPGNRWLVGVALLIENQVKMVGGWEIVSYILGYYDFIDRIADFIFIHMHEFSELDTAFLKEITRFVQEEIDVAIKEDPNE